MMESVLISASTLTDWLNTISCSNLGTVPAASAESGFAVTAFRLMLNAELEPLVGVATAGGRLCLTLTSDNTSDAGWISRALERLRSETSA